MARVKLPLSAAGRVHDMGGQPGGPVPIDSQGQPVFVAWRHQFKRPVGADGARAGARSDT